MGDAGDVKPLPNPAAPKPREAGVTQVELNLYSAIVGRPPRIEPPPAPPTGPAPVANLANDLARRVKNPTLYLGLATATRRLLEGWARLAGHRPVHGNGNGNGNGNADGARRR